MLNIWIITKRIFLFILTLFVYLSFILPSYIYAEGDIINGGGVSEEYIILANVKPEFIDVNKENDDFIKKLNTIFPGSGYTKYFIDNGGDSDDTNTQNKAFNKLIQKIITDVAIIAFSIVILIFTARIILAFIDYILSGPDDEKLKKSKKKIESLLRTLLYIILLFTILNILTSAAGLGNFTDIKMFQVNVKP